MNISRRLPTSALLGATLFSMVAGFSPDAHSAEVRVSRFWHNHQPIYWPEWNSAPQNERVQFAQDSINLKAGQYYDSGTAHPENDLNAIFGVDDRKNAYQAGPRNSLSGVNNGGYSMSYSGSLIDNVNNLGANGHSGYGTGWWDGNREATKWTHVRRQPETGPGRASPTITRWVRCCPRPSSARNSRFSTRPPRRRGTWEPPSNHSKGILSDRDGVFADDDRCARGRGLRVGDRRQPPPEPHEPDLQ